MNISDYTFLLNKPDAVNDRQTQQLEKIVDEFPYFQSARALRLKGLYNKNSFQYNHALKVTAAHTTDRSVLFDFITSDTFTAIHKGLYERKLAELFDIEVNESEVVETLTQSDPAINKVEQSILTSIRESEIPYDQEVFYDEVIPDEISDTAINKMEVIDDDEDNDDEDEEEIIIIDQPGNQGMISQPEEKTDAQFEDFANAEATGQDQVIRMIPKDADHEREMVSSAEQKLEIGKPLAFSPDEKHSFQEWLQLSKFKPIDRTEKPRETDVVEKQADFSDKVKKNELIEKFIEASPKIPPVRQDAKPLNIPEQPDDNAHLMTETLARVYLEQKKYSKAIQAYEILILKYPEKSSFFADRISEIKNLQQNNFLQ